MATEKQVPDGKTPPYISYSRFEKFIESLHGKPLPPRIDRTLMSRMSGGDQSQLRITMRFFRLIEGADQTVTDRFRSLVTSYGTDDWQAVLRQVVEASYEPITEGLDDAATHGQLEERFRERGTLVGSALVKATRFYMAAAEAAGLPLSPHYKKGGRSKGTAAPNGQRVRTPRKSSEARSQQRTPEGTDEIQVPVPGKIAKVVLSKDLTQAEFDFVLATLKSWRKLKGTTAG